jgi:outer membrane protein TolC
MNAPAKGKTVKHPLVLALALIFIFPVADAQTAAQAKNQPGLKPESQAILKTLPRNTVSLEIVVAYAIRNSAEFRAIHTDLITRDLPLLAQTAELATVLSASGSYTDSRLQPPGGFFNPTRRRTELYSLRAAKAFTTGTSLTAALNFTPVRLEFPPGATSGLPPGAVPPEAYEEALVSFGLRQNLWADAFGRATRNSLRAAELASQATTLDVEQRRSQWLLGLVRAYYGIWIARAQLAAAEERLQIQNRLLRVTRVKAQRGTASNSELLRIQNAVALTRDAMTRVKLDLTQTWQQLVFSLDLPHALLEEDPALIPMELDDPTEMASALCAERVRAGEVSDPTSPELRALDLGREGSDRAIESARSRLNPNLYLELRGSSNAINGGLSETLPPALLGENPELFVGLTLEWPLTNDRALAAYLEAAQRKARTEALKSQVENRLRVDWLSSCSQLQSAIERVKMLEDVTRGQRTRLRQEEQRFELARNPIFDVIQAADDVTSAQVSLSSAEVEKRTAAWTLLVLGEQVESVMKKSAALLGVQL